MGTEATRLLREYLLTEGSGSFNDFLTNEAFSGKFSEACRQELTDDALLSLSRVSSNLQYRPSRDWGTKAPQVGEWGKKIDLPSDVQVLYDVWQDDFQRFFSPVQGKAPQEEAVALARLFYEAEQNGWQSRVCQLRGSVFSLLFHWLGDSAHVAIRLKEAGVKKDLDTIRTTISSQAYAGQKLEKFCKDCIGDLGAVVFLPPEVASFVTSNGIVKKNFRAEHDRLAKELKCAGIIRRSTNNRAEDFLNKLKSFIVKELNFSSTLSVLRQGAFRDGVRAKKPTKGKISKEDRPRRRNYHRRAVGKPADQEIAVREQQGRSGDNFLQPSPASDQSAAMRSSLQQYNLLPNDLVCTTLDQYEYLTEIDGNVDRRRGTKSNNHPANIPVTQYPGHANNVMGQQALPEMADHAALIGDATNTMVADSTGRDTMNPLVYADLEQYYHLLVDERMDDGDPAAAQANACLAGDEQQTCHFALPTDKDNAPSFGHTTDFQSTTDAFHHLNNLSRGPISVGR